MMFFVLVLCGLFKQGSVDSSDENHNEQVDILVPASEQFAELVSRGWRSRDEHKGVGLMDYLEDNGDMTRRGAEQGESRVVRELGSDGELVEWNAMINLRVDLSTDDDVEKNRPYLAGRLPRIENQNKE